MKKRVQQPALTFILSISRLFTVIYILVLLAGVTLLLTGSRLARLLGNMAAFGYNELDWKSLLINLTSSLILIAGVSFFTDRLTHRAISEFMRLQLSSTVDRMNNVAAPLANAGCQGFSIRRDPAIYNRLLREAFECFCAMGTSLPDVTNFTFLAEVVEKINADDQFFAEFIILNPHSSLSAFKSGISPYGGDSRKILHLIRNAIVNVNIARSALVRPEQKARLRLRLMSTIPTCSCVFNESMMDIAFYDELREGNRTPSWRFEKIVDTDQSASLYGYYSHNFHVVWHRSDSIDYHSPDCATEAEKIGQEQLAHVNRFASMVRESVGIFDFDA